MEQKARRLTDRREALMRELAETESMIRGSLVETGKKCGRKDCGCAKGKLHPHRYLSAAGGGRNRIVYVPDREKPAFAKGLKAYEKAWRLICRISEINIAIIKGGGCNE